MVKVYVSGASSDARPRFKVHKRLENGLLLKITCRRMRYFTAT